MKAGKLNKSIPISCTLGQMNEESREEDISRTEKKRKKLKHLQEGIRRGTL